MYNCSHWQKIIQLQQNIKLNLMCKLNLKSRDIIKHWLFIQQILILRVLIFYTNLKRKLIVILKSIEKILSVKWEKQKLSIQSLNLHW